MSEHLSYRRSAIEICDRWLGPIPRDTTTLKAIALASEMARPATETFAEKIRNRMAQAFEEQTYYRTEAEVYNAMYTGFYEIKNRLYYGQLADKSNIAGDIICDMLVDWYGVQWYHDPSPPPLKPPAEVGKKHKELRKIARQTCDQFLGKLPRDRVTKDAIMVAKTLLRFGDGRAQSNLDAAHERVLSHFKRAITDEDSEGAAYSVWLALFVVRRELEPRLVLGPLPGKIKIRRLCDALIKRMTTLPVGLRYADEVNNPTPLLFPELSELC
jgi:hypothetical protein